MSSLYPELRAAAEVEAWIEAHGEELELAGGVLPDEILGLIDANDADFAAKTERLVMTIRNLEAHADAASIEAERLRKLAVSRKRKAATIKANILRAFEQTGRDLVQTDLCRVSRVRGPVSVRLTDPDAEPPDRFTRIKYEFDKTAAKAAWQHVAPEEPGAVDVPNEGITLERKAQLRIK